MIAIIGLVLYVIAAILKLVGKYPGSITWLLIIAGALVAIDVIWGWHRAGAGYYRRSGPAA
jgi:hypothetical protein